MLIFLAACRERWENGWKKWMEKVCKKAGKCQEKRQREWKRRLMWDLGCQGIQYGTFDMMYAAMLHEHVRSVDAK